MCPSSAGVNDFNTMYQIIQFYFTKTFWKFGCNYFYQIQKNLHNRIAPICKLLFPQSDPSMHYFVVSFRGDNSLHRLYWNQCLWRFDDWMFALQSTNNYLLLVNSFFVIIHVLIFCFIFVFFILCILGTNRNSFNFPTPPGSDGPRPMAIFELLEYIVNEVC